MNGYGYYGPSEEHQPVTHWKGYPIFAAHFVVIVYCALMIVMAVLGQQGVTLYQALGFSSRDVFAGQLWRLFTYGLFNFPSLNFALDMLMIVWFGRELERTFGRRRFFFLYGGIYLVPTVVLSLIGLLRPTAFAGQPGALALFVAFATHFPGAPLFFALLAKWAAVILVGIFTLIHLFARDWVSMTLLWSTCGFAHLFVRHQQGAFSLPSLSLFRRKPKLRALPDLPSRKPAAVAKIETSSSMAEVDALLDKIATSGMASLTPKERAKLDAAREGLIKRGSGRS
jgi:membrane associated rhomboid family serine protease